MSDLPRGWASVRLGDILPLKYGKGLTKTNRNHGAVPVYGSSGIIGHHDYALTQRPAVIVGRKGSVGQVHLSYQPCWPIDTVYYAQDRPDIHLPFFRYLLERLDLGRLDRSTAIPGLTLTDYEKIEIDLPPLPEQRRIVAEIEKQFTRLDQAATLILACEPKLNLLISTVLHTSFSHEWPMLRLRDLAQIKGGLAKDTNRRDIAQCMPVPYLRVANVQRGFLDLRVIKQIMATPAEIEDLKLQSGDVLFTEGGDRDKLGRGWIWQGEVDGCIHQNHVFRARLGNRVLPKWVSYYANAVGAHYFHREGKQTTNLASINITKLGSLPVPVPPIKEQEHIVAEIEKQLTEFQHLASELQAGIAHHARLRQSILAKAFSGRLVSQDPNDESASILLARIGRNYNGNRGKTKQGLIFA